MLLLSVCGARQIVGDVFLASSFSHRIQHCVPYILFHIPPCHPHQAQTIQKKSPGQARRRRNSNRMWQHFQLGPASTHCRDEANRGRDRKSKSEFYDPCQEAAQRSYKCLYRNNGDKTMCADYFQCVFTSSIVGSLLRWTMEGMLTWGLLQGVSRLQTSLGKSTYGSH